MAKRTVLLAVILVLFLFIVSCKEETKVIVGEEEGAVEETAPEETPEEAPPEEPAAEEEPEAEEEQPEEGVTPTILVPDYETVDISYMATPVEVDGTTVRIMKYEAKKIDGDAYVWGIVENLGNEEAEDIVVFVYLFNKHVIVEKTYTFVEGRDIPPGEQRKFEVTVPDTEFEAYFMFPGQA